MAARKTITVLRLCQIVNSERIPVNGNDVEFGRGWQDFKEWGKKRIRASRCCPDAVRAGKRKIPVRRDGTEAECRCHGKLQLVEG